MRCSHLKVAEPVNGSFGQKADPVQSADLTLQIRLARRRGPLGLALGT